jgi:endonuclease/exonuclease/phosphatase family metal-dependent hydrolase
VDDADPRGGLRLASFNIRAGRGPDGRADPRRLRSALNGLGADVLALQEVDRDQGRSGGVDQAALAAAALGVEGPAHVRFEATVGCLGRRRCGCDGAPGPGYGLALVSRLPIARWRRVELPGSGEPRIALAAVLAGPAPVRTVVTTHLSALPVLGAIQLRRLAAAVGDLPDPLVLLGDLNLPAPVAARLLPGWQAVGRGPTFPTSRPRLRLDQAHLRDGHRLSCAGDVVATAVSDHRALTVDL